MSRCLAERSIDHVLLERGEVAHTWRTERWDSLRLLTPNWQSRLPGFRYDGYDPDGYRTMPEVIDFIAAYAKSISAPVRTHTTVTSVRSAEPGYLVRTNRGDWRCKIVVGLSTSRGCRALPTACRHRSQCLRPKHIAIRSSSPTVASPVWGGFCERYADRA
jgi:putative flavoprotein involved in K+ transport